MFSGDQGLLGLLGGIQGYAGGYQQGYAGAAQLQLQRALQQSEMAKNLAQAKYFGDHGDYFAGRNPTQIGIATGFLPDGTPLPGTGAGQGGGNGYGGTLGAQYARVGNGVAANANNFLDDVARMAPLAKTNPSLVPVLNGYASKTYGMGPLFAPDGSVNLTDQQSANVNKTNAETAGVRANTQGTLGNNFLRYEGFLGNQSPKVQVGIGLGYNNAAGTNNPVPGVPWQAQTSNGAVSLIPDRLTPDLPTQAKIGLADAQTTLTNTNNTLAPKKFQEKALFDAGLLQNSATANSIRLRLGLGNLALGQGRLGLDQLTSLPPSMGGIAGTIPGKSGANPQVAYLNSELQRATQVIQQANSDKNKGLTQPLIGPDGKQMPYRPGVDLNRDNVIQAANTRILQAQAYQKSLRSQLNSLTSATGPAIPTGGLPPANPFGSSGGSSQLPPGVKPIDMTTPASILNARAQAQTAAPQPRHPQSGRMLPKPSAPGSTRAQARANILSRLGGK